MKKNFIVISLMIGVLFSSGCASSKLSAIEDAQFSLDRQDYNSAISRAQAALAADPGNIQATRILASAYFGRSGLDFLDLAERLTDLASSTDPKFSQVADVLPANGDLADLRLAVEALETLSGIDDTGLDVSNESLADAVFDLGFMQAIEHFAIGVYQSGYKTGTMDVTAISEDNATDALNDLLDFDNRLINSGVDSSESFLSDIRQTFCILEPISAGDGFTQTEYQALVGCQLEPASFDPSTVDAGIANCAALEPDNQSADVLACFGADTTL